MRTVIGVVVLLTALTAGAQAPPSFREGVLAFEKKEWAAAEKAMRAAIAGNPKESEGTVSIAGSWFETYVPHYFLARALARQGKCAEALVEFAESERQGVTPTIPDFARHLRTRGGCKPEAKKKEPRVIDVAVVPFGDEEAPPPKTTTTPKTTTVAPPKPEVAVRPKPPNDDTRKRLAAAVDAYLRGDYASTVGLLDAKPFTDRAAAGEAALFRAAARDALYRIDGSKDDALRQAVEKDLSAYRVLRPNRRPDPRVFPPRFVAMVGAPE